MNRPKETMPEGARLAEATRAHLVGWRIPDGVPISPDTAIVPLRPDPDMVRTACRALHTLLVRSCPDSVLLLGMRPDDGTRPALVATGKVPTPLGSVGVDVGRAARIRTALRGRIDVEDGDRLAELSAGTGLETIPVLLQVLAPGCRVIPFLLSAEGEPSPRELGRLFAELFTEESVVLAAASEFGEEHPEPGERQPAKERLRSRDAEMMRPLLDLELDETVRVAYDGGASAPAVLEAAVAHARACGAQQGHLIEYTRTVEDPDGSWIGRAGIVF